MGSPTIIVDKTMLNGALMAANEGFRVFPQRNKVPIIKDWPNRASSDYDEVTAFWEKDPGAHVGAATGKKGGIIVLDVDVKNGSPGMASFTKLKQDYIVPMTLMHSTPSGGIHVFYTYPKDMMKIRNMNQLPGYPGIELKADGGAVTLPPSPGYKAISHIGKPMPCPSWLAAIIRSHNRRYDEESPPRQLITVNQASPVQQANPVTSGGSIIEGERNNKLAGIAGKLHQSGVVYDLILSSLQSINKQQCLPPLPDNEVKSIVDSISRYKRNKQPKEKPGDASDEAIQMYPVSGDYEELRRGLKMQLIYRPDLHIIDRRAEAGLFLLNWMKAHGFFFQTTAGEPYYFFNDDRKLRRIEKDEFVSFLHKITGLNPAGRDCLYFYHDCRTVALDAEKKPMYQDTYFDEDTNTEYINQYNGMVLKLDGETVTQIPNGRDVVFEERPECKPFEPDYSKSDVLDDYIYQTPNWSGDKESCGIAYLSWIVATFFTELCPTRPILTVLGERGSGKSMVLRILLKNLYGNDANLSGVPDKPDAFISAAAADHIMVMDNMDTVMPWQRDKLARIATGSIDQYRKLYTTNDCARIHYRSWVACTSRDPGTLRRDDLVERLVILHLDRVQADSRVAENHFMKNADLTRNQWWGCVLTLINKVIKAIKQGYMSDKVKLRMGDWERLGRVVAKVTGKDAAWNRYVNSLPENQSELLLEGEPICDAVEKWLEIPENTGRRIVSRDLFQEYSDITDKLKSDRGWYKTLHSFCRKFSEIKSDLASRYGMKWEKGTTQKTHNKMVYWFDKPAG